MSKKYPAKRAPYPRRQAGRRRLAGQVQVEVALFDAHVAEFEQLDRRLKNIRLTEDMDNPAVLTAIVDIEQRLQSGRDELARQREMLVDLCKLHGLHDVVIPEMDVPNG